MRAHLAGFLLAGMCLLATTSAAAQQSAYRKGFWLAFGAGPGYGKGTCGVCVTTRETGPAGQVRVGGTISEHLSASVEGTGWRGDGAVTLRQLAMVSAVGTWYPLPRLGLHGKAGLGGYWYQEEDAVTQLTSQGMALQVGVGYDIPLTPAVAVTPFATLVRSGFGNPSRLDKASGFKQPLFSDLTVSFYQVGLGITLY
jgi:hypothetical protein